MPRARYFLIAFVLLHFAIVGLFVFSVIPQEYHPADQPFWFHNGGDNSSYFELASALYSGSLIPSKYPLGFPLTLIPFIAVFRPQRQEDLLQIVSAFWSLVMFPLAQLVLFRLAQRLTRQTATALVAVFLFTILPLIFYGVLRPISNGPFAEVGAVHLIWAQMLSDGPATLVTMLAYLAYLEWLERAKRHAPRLLVWEIALGALIGYLFILRYTAIITGVLIVLLLLTGQHWRALIVVSAAALVIALPQLIYNATYFGSPFVTGYTTLDTLPPHGLFHISYLLDALGKIMGRLGWIFPLIVVAALALFATALYLLYRRSALAALIVSTWIIGYLALYATYYYSWNGGLLRFLMPIYPAIAILGAVTLVSLWQAIRGSANERSVALQRVE